jgi:hypothetical protein
VGAEGAWAQTGAIKHPPRSSSAASATFAEGEETTPFARNEAEGRVVSSDEFDGLGMLQQNKGCPSLCGPVAQLGARFHGMEEVTGSIPVRSTNQSIQWFSCSSLA